MSFTLKWKINFRRFGKRKFTQMIFNNLLPDIIFSLG